MARVNLHVPDRVVNVAAAVSAPVLTTLVDQHVMSASFAADLGGIVAAAVAAYHGGQAVGKAKARRSSPGVSN